MTARINPLNPETAAPEVQEMFKQVKSKIGMIPNALKTMAQSTGLLGGYLGLSGSLSKGNLAPVYRELVALYVSQQNECEYCLSSHSLTGKHAGLNPDQLIQARKGHSDDPKGQGVLTLTQQLLEKRGNVSDDQLEAARAAGLTEAEIVEIVGHVALSTLTNFVNQLAHTDVEFPKVSVAL